MSNYAPNESSSRRIRSLRPGGEHVVYHAAPAAPQTDSRRREQSLLSRLAQFQVTGSAAFLNWVIPYLKSPFSFFYALAAVLVLGGILNATFSQASEYLDDGYAFYAAFVYCQDPTDPHQSFWRYGLCYFVGPIMGLTTACLAGLALAYISIGVGAGLVVCYVGWGTSNFYQYTLPGIIALIQCGLMATVFKSAADLIFGLVVLLYTMVVAAFWTFLLLFTCVTWVHWLIEWSMRPAL